MSAGIIRDTFHFRQTNVSESMLKEAPIGSLDVSRGSKMLIMVHIVRKLRWQRRGLSHFTILKIFHKHKNSFTILGLCRDIFLVPCAFSKILKQAENQIVCDITPSPSGQTFGRHKAPSQGCLQEGCVPFCYPEPSCIFFLNLLFTGKGSLQRAHSFQNRQDLLQRL